MRIVRIVEAKGDPEQYHTVEKLLEQDDSDYPPAGLRVHVAMRTSIGVRIVSVYDSEEQAEANMPRLRDALSAAEYPETLVREQYELVNLIIP